MISKLILCVVRFNQLPFQCGRNLVPDDLVTKWLFKHELMYGLDTDCSPGQKQVTCLPYVDEQFNSLPVHCDFSYFAVKCIYNTMKKRALYDKKLANARALFTVLFRLL